MTSSTGSGYLWLCRVVFDLFGAEPPSQVLRLLSAAFAGLGLALLLIPRAFRRDGLAVVVAGLISFTAPVVVAGLWAGVDVHRHLARDVQARPFAPAFIVTGAVAVLYAAAVCLLLNRGLVALQLQAYGHVYTLSPDQGLASLAVRRFGSTLQVVVSALGNTWLSGARDPLQQLGVPLGLTLHLVRLGALVLFVAVALIARKRAPEIVAVTQGVFAVMAVLHVSGFLAMPYKRNGIFLVPFSAAMTALAVAHLLQESLPVAGQAVVAGLVRPQRSLSAP